MGLPDIQIELSSKEKNLVKRALLLLGVFTLILTVAGLASLFFTRRHQPMIVPRVIGLDQNQATRALSSKGLHLVISHSQFDEHMPEGLILIQNPKANGYLKRDMAVTAVLSKGSPQAGVPNVIGLSFTEAQISLAGNHLRAGRESLIFSPFTPKDIVIAQVPNAGVSVDSFTEVNMLVSNGPMNPAFVMPRLKDMSMEEVFKILRPVGVTVEKIKNEVHDDLDPGTVLSQSPLPGAKIQKKDGISLVVSAKSSGDLSPRYAKIEYDMPEENSRRLQIDVFDSSGTRTIYNKMASPKEHIELGANVTGKASALIYINQEFAKEIPIP